MATKLNAGIKTSSPISTPASIKATCSAEVPLTVAMAYFVPVYSANSFSKQSTKFPTEETNVESEEDSKEVPPVENEIVVETKGASAEDGESEEKAELPIEEEVTEEVTEEVQE